MFVHPLCPCSKASVAELARLLETSNGRCAATIYFVVPNGSEVSPRDSEPWQQVALLANTTLTIDRDGNAAKWGANASGQTFVFDRHHTLRFKGGLTRARGKTGPTNASRAILDLIDGDTSQTLIESPVFGCSLH